MKTKILLLTIMITLSLNSFSQTFTLSKIKTNNVDFQKLIDEHPDLNPFRFIKINFKNIYKYNSKNTIRYSSTEFNNSNPLKNLTERITYEAYAYEENTNNDYGNDLKWEICKPIGIENAEDIVMKLLIKRNLDVVIMLENKKENLIIVAEYNIN